MTFDAGALAAFAFTVIGAFTWLIWQGSASNSKQNAQSADILGMREDFAEHRKEFNLHVKADEDVDRKVVGLLNGHDTRLAILEDRRHIERREDERAEKRREQQGNEVGTLAGMQRAIEKVSACGMLRMQQTKKENHSLPIAFYVTDAKTYEFVTKAQRKEVVSEIIRRGKERRKLGKFVVV